MKCFIKFLFEDFNWFIYLQVKIILYVIDLFLDVKDVQVEKALYGVC